MKVAVNTRLLLKNRLEGIGNFILESFERITKAHSDHEFIFIFDRPFDPGFISRPNITPVVIPPPARHPVLFYLWFEYSIPFILKKTKADIFVSPDGFLSLKTRVPQIAVIHDINFHHRPNDLPSNISRYYNRNFPKFAMKANRVVTVSEFSKKDIGISFGIEQSKIDVVYNGVNARFKPLSLQEIEKIKNQYSSGTDYFFYVGSMHPRKNLENLILAYNTFRESGSTKTKLLLAGDFMFDSHIIKSIHQSSPYRNDILFLGRVSEQELTGLMGAATALTFIPFFEGFGVPLLEAMYADVPIIASEVTSLPEVCGEAALYADPASVDSIKNCMLRITQEEGLRQRLIDAGKKQREKFSWDKTANLLWSSIEQTISTINFK